jgi:hypothetical protein
MYVDDGTWASRLALKDKSQATVQDLAGLIKVRGQGALLVAQRLSYQVAVICGQKGKGEGVTMDTGNGAWLSWMAVLPYLFTGAAQIMCV